MKKNRIKVLSIHWGFSLGGVGKYALLIDDVYRYEPILIQSVCILNRDWQCDIEGLKKLKAEKIYIGSRFDFSWIIKVLKYIRQSSPDLIMTHGFNGHFVVLLTKLISGHGIRLVCSYHGLYHATTRNRGFFFEKLINNFTEFYIKNIAAGVISVAEYSKHYLLEKGISGKKITVIHNGIELSLPLENSRESLRREWGISDEQPLIGIASRLDSVKGLNYLIDAFKQLTKKYENVRLVVIGTGKSEEALKMQAEKLELSDKVIFTGFRSDITNCLAAFDVFALPSLAEYHSIALLEAMQAGKPIVATNVGGNTESVRHKMEGLIVCPADPAGLEKAIDKYLDNPEFAQKMGKNAKERFHKHFTVDIMVKKTADWIKGVQPT